MHEVKCVQCIKHKKLAQIIYNSYYYLDHSLTTRYAPAHTQSISKSYLYHSCSCRAHSSCQVTFYLPHFTMKTMSSVRPSDLLSGEVETNVEPASV